MLQKYHTALNWMEDSEVLDILTNEGYSFLDMNSNPLEFLRNKLMKNEISKSAIEQYVEKYID